jgi:hypothetical protein
VIKTPDFLLIAHGNHVIVTPQTKHGLKFIHQHGIPLREGCVMELCPDGAELFAEAVEDAGLSYTIMRLPSRVTVH